MIYELEPIYDTRKSFYGKATVVTSDNGVELISYSTKVAKITNDGQAIVYGQYSQTTSRHVKEFLLQHNFRARNTKQILKDYSPKKEGESND